MNNNRIYLVTGAIPELPHGTKISEVDHSEKKQGQRRKNAVPA